MSPRAERVTWLVGLLAATAYVILISGWVDSLVLRLIIKPLPILCLIVWVWRSGDGAYRRTIAAGLSCAMVGDVFLVMTGQAWFLAGLVANLVAHIIYTVAFTRDVRTPHPLLSVPFLAWVTGMFLFLRGGLGPMQLPVAVYSLAIALMMWRASARVQTWAWAPALAGALGAIAFGLSDTILALNRFHAPIAHAKYPIIGLYWLGQLGIAWSTRADRRVTG